MPPSAGTASRQPATGDANAGGSRSTGAGRCESCRGGRDDYFALPWFATAAILASIAAASPR